MECSAPLSADFVRAGETSRYPADIVVVKGRVPFMVYFSFFNRLASGIVKSKMLTLKSQGRLVRFFGIAIFVVNIDAINENWNINVGNPTVF